MTTTILHLDLLTGKPEGG